MKGAENSGQSKAYTVMPFIELPRNRTGECNMKEFIEKLIGRLEELKKIEQNRHDDCDEEGYGDAEQIYGDGRSQGRFEQTHKIIEIVNQLAEEYKGGWIPCSDRLPEEKEQERTVYDPITLAEVDIERYMASDLVNVTVRSWDSDEVFACDDCTVDGKWVNFNGEQYEVIAWMPLPAHYTEGE